MTQGERALVSALLRIAAERNSGPWAGLANPRYLLSSSWNQSDFFLPMMDHVAGVLEWLLGRWPRSADELVVAADAVEAGRWPGGEVLAERIASLAATEATSDDPPVGR